MFSHKRHLQDPFDQQHAAKRRLVDHLNGLSLALDTNGGNPSSTVGTPNSTATELETAPKPTLFGSFTKEQLQKPLTDPNRVVIRNIDQFLHENPDKLDLIGEKVNLDDLRRAGLDKLVISCGLDIKKAWTKIVSRFRENDSPENKDLNDLIYKLIWDEYLAKYFSLVKYYNPKYLIWQLYKQWEHRQRQLEEQQAMNSHYVTEIDTDGDEMMVDDSAQQNSQYHNINTHHNQDQLEYNPLESREQSLRDGTSSYGSYYTHDDNANSFINHNYSHYHYDPDAMIEDVDDDVMMED